MDQDPIKVRVANGCCTARLPHPLTVTLSHAPVDGDEEYMKDAIKLWDWMRDTLPGGTVDRLFWLAFANAEPGTYTAPNAAKDMDAAFKKEKYPNTI